MEDMYQLLEDFQLEVLGYINEGEYDRAEFVCRRFSSQYKDNASVQRIVNYSLGVIYLNKGELSEAENYFKTALGYSPLHPEIHYLLGKVYLLENRTGDALREFDIAVNQDPGNMEYFELFTRTEGEVRGHKMG